MRFFMRGDIGVSFRMFFLGGGLSGGFSFFMGVMVLMVLNGLVIDMVCLSKFLFSVFLVSGPRSPRISSLCRSRF